MSKYRLLTLAMLCGTMSLQAQTASTPAAKADTTGGATGFSIETEMLTYRSLESNGEAIACDIVGYLDHVPVFPKSNTPPPKKFVPGTPLPPLCNVKDVPKATASVILMPFDKSQLADFEIWRADMATMARLQKKAQAFKCGPTPRAGTTTATAAASSVLSLTPAGPPLALASGVAGLLASEETSTPVGGTIQDQAFMDAVARQLGALGMPVLMPSAYAPGSLEALDPTASPYLASLERTLAITGCLKQQTTKSDSNPNPQTESQAMKDLETEITDFQTTLKDAPATPAGAGGNNTTTTKPVSTASHMGSVLLADGLAVQLGVDPSDGTQDGSDWHILMVKALESGGSVSHKTTVLGSKISYSGGSVGTYALFTSDGKLECSGNVYDYAGSFSSKNFVQGLHEYHADPGQQMTFLRGGCSVPKTGTSGPR